MSKSIALIPLLLTGCYGSGNHYIEDSLWNTQTASTAASTYVELPHAGQLIQINEAPDGGTWSVVDLDGAEPTAMTVAPDGSQVLVFARWPECKDTDEEILNVIDCSGEDLAWNTELAVVEDGKRTSVSEIAPHMNTVAFSGDGTVAVAYLDYTAGADIEIDGLADLGEVRFINLLDGSVGSASVGFSPSKVLFSADGTSAVVMSRSKVVKVDLNTFEKVLEAPLTLDADAQVDPSGAELTPDGSTLLITVEGSSDLYMLDLDTVYWNIGALGAVPSTLSVDSVTDTSVFVFANQTEVNVLDNSRLDIFSQESIDSIALEEPANSIEMADGMALLYNTSGTDYHDVYRLDLSNSDLIEYVVSNPVSSMRMLDSGRLAVAILRPESSASNDLDGYQDARWGLAVIDMASDEAISLVTESEPVGLELVEDDGSAYALVLLSGLDYLLHVDLSSPGEAEQIDLPAPPLSIEALPDGRFLIAHDAPLGLITYLDPTDLSQTSVSGFATAGVFSDDVLPRTGEE
ncbi:MAG: hypothetical protein P8R54_16185 [Myxococcota bacterium]|nr:hypothetical protein [Myxococcota bacterium]